MLSADEETWICTANQLCMHEQETVRDDLEADIWAHIEHTQRRVISAEDLRQGRDKRVQLFEECKAYKASRPRGIAAGSGTPAGVPGDSRFYPTTPSKTAVELLHERGHMFAHIGLPHAFMHTPGAKVVCTSPAEGYGDPKKEACLLVWEANGRRAGSQEIV